MKYIMKLQLYKLDWSWRVLRAWPWKVLQLSKNKNIMKSYKFQYPIRNFKNKNVFKRKSKVD